MNSTQNTSGFQNPRELSGVLVYDAIMRRDGIVGSHPTQADSVQVCGHRMTEVRK
jgi:hypothetical protein